MSCFGCLHKKPKNEKSLPLVDPPVLDDDAGVSKKLPTLWFVTVVSNPARFNSRIALYREFRKHITEELGSNLLTVECSLGERGHSAVRHEPDKVTRSLGPRGNQIIDVRVKNNSWLWIKESLMNVGASHLPHQCEYIVFADADIRFLDARILSEIIHSLQTYKVVQPFETCIDLGPTGQVVGVHRSFGSCNAQGHIWNPVKREGINKFGKKYQYVSSGSISAGFGNPWHPGYALAMKKTTFEKLGGLLDSGILGAGDHHMCASFVGKCELSFPGGVSQAYKTAVKLWQERALRVVQKNFGYVCGSIVHGWHGSKQSRQYISRWDILIRHGFDPTKHVQKNSHGVAELHKDCPSGLRDDIIRYFMSRNEDSNQM